jgi:hypothetical protein
MAPPAIKFRTWIWPNLCRVHKVLTGPFFLFDVRTDYVKVTNDTVLVPITVQIKNSGHHVQYQGRGVEGRCQHYRAGFDDYRPGGAEF